MLQQYLPFTVLKLTEKAQEEFGATVSLQQYLPFTVLKPSGAIYPGTALNVATVLTVYGIETTWKRSP